MALFIWLAIVSVVLLLLVYVFTRAVLHRIEIDFITERYVFITGCDSGFGRLLARRLDGKGVKVIAGCLTKQGSTELRDECSSRLLTILIDITNKESVQNAFNSVKKIVGQNRLWGLVNNAGVMPNYGPAEMTTIEEYEKVCNINLLGTISVTLSFLPLLRESRGRLVTVCSVTSSCPIPGIANYVVSKAGIKMFSGCLRRELRGSGMRIATIEPGGFETSITDNDRLTNVLKGTFRRANTELQDYYGGKIAKYIMFGIRNSQFFKNDPKMVIDVMEHALFARFPRRRYLVGPDAKYFFRPLMYGPDWLSDFVLSWPAPYGEKEKGLGL